MRGVGAVRQLWASWARVPTLVIALIVVNALAVGTVWIYYLDRGAWLVGLMLGLWVSIATICIASVVDRDH